MIRCECVLECVQVMQVSVFLALSWLLLLQAADGELDYESQGQGLHLQGDFSIAGLFPLHYTDGPADGLPALVPCDE